MERLLPMLVGGPPLGCNIESLSICRAIHPKKIKTEREETKPPMLNDHNNNSINSNHIIYQ